MPFCWMPRCVESLRLGASANFWYYSSGLGKDTGYSYCPKSTGKFEIIRSLKLISYRILVHVLMLILLNADWCGIPCFQYCFVCVWFEENFTTSKRYNGLAIFLWKFSTKKFFQRKTSKFEKAHVCHFSIWYFFYVVSKCLEEQTIDPFITLSSMDVKTIEEDKSGTDPEDEVTFDIPNVTEYRDVFQPTRSRKYRIT